MSPGQPTLPGMEDPSQFAERSPTRPKRGVTKRQDEQRRFDNQEKKTRRRATGPVMSNWSGPDPGQQIMGVHDLAEDNGQLDMHGFVSEAPPGEWNKRAANGMLIRPTPRPGFISPDTNNLGSGGNGFQARHLYRTVGGSYSDEPHVKKHWKAQPLVQVPSDAVIHTGQHVSETEIGREPYGEPPPGPDDPTEGRARVNTIREDLMKGNPVRNPAWLVKHNNRLYALDGHHRILAAREAGLESFPARIWDRDAERPRKSRSRGARA